VAHNPGDMSYRQMSDGCAYAGGAEAVAAVYQHRCIDANLCGDDPDSLSLEKLRKNLPVRWEEQREGFGRSAKR